MRSRLRVSRLQGREHRAAEAVAVYLGLYLVLDRISLVEVVDGVEFTLWNPTPGLGLALVLSRGFGYAPILFLAGVFGDGVLDGWLLGAAATVTVDAIVAIGYSAIAVVLLRCSDISYGLRRVGDVIRVLLIAGGGTLAVAVFVTGSLLCFQKLPTDQFAFAIRHFWTSDFCGIMGLLPALLTARAAWERWRELSVGARLIDLAVFAIGLTLAFAVIFGRATEHEFQFFYLLLLPIAWIGVRHGLPWCAIAILVEQVALVALLAVLGYARADFLAFQELSLVIAGTGLAIGAVVNERQQAELLLRRQQGELGRTARLTAVGELGSTIVHEVSQPLATIATYVHACRRVLNAQAVRSVELVETLAKAEAEALRAGEIVERVRDVLAGGSVRLYAGDVTDSVRKIVAVLADEARSRNVQVTVHARHLPMVMADHVQIEQVLLNLIRNGIDAAGDHNCGEKWVKVEARRSEHGVEVAVEDNGSGVAPEIAERLFEPFETSKPRGLGLGLSLSYRIVEAHHGRLWWDQASGGGARFVFHLPGERTTPHGR